MVFKCDGKVFTIETLLILLAPVVQMLDSAPVDIKVLGKPLCYQLDIFVSSG